MKLLSRAILLFSVTAVFVAPVCGQNLIVNSSFEEYSVPCSQVQGKGRIYDAHGWERATRDYFDASDLISPCSAFGFKAPMNERGFQYPYFGSNYAFIGTVISWNSPSDHYFTIESIQPTIKSELKPNLCYKIVFKISLADDSNEYRPIGLDLLFTQEDFTMQMWTKPIVSPQVTYTELDTLSRQEWQTIETEFTLNDTMNYLTIGWFSFPSSFPSSRFAQIGYYIDNVVLYPCSAQTYVADAGSDQLACKGDSVTFSTPYRNEEYRYLWLNTSGDTLSTSTDLTVEVSEDHEYYLWQLDFKYDESWDTVRVRMEGCPELELPNVFTPNGDNKNDLWIPVLRDIDEMDISIFSRWGETVFQYSGASETFAGWDGSDVPEGTYYAVVKARSDQGRTIEEKTTLTLLR